MKGFWNEYWGIKWNLRCGILDKKEVQALLKEDKLLDSLYKRYMREDNGMLESLEEILQENYKF